MQNLPKIFCVFDLKNFDLFSVFFSFLRMFLMWFLGGFLLVYAKLDIFQIKCLSDKFWFYKLWELQEKKIVSLKKLTILSTIRHK